MIIKHNVILENIMSSLFTLEEEPEIVDEKHIVSTIDVTALPIPKKELRRIKKKKKKIHIKNIPLKSKDKANIEMETIIPDSIIPDEIMEYQKHMKQYARKYWSTLKQMGCILRQTPKEDYKDIYNSMKNLSLKPQKEYTLISLENDL